MVVILTFVRCTLKQRYKPTEIDAERERIVSDVSETTNRPDRKGSPGSRLRLLAALFLAVAIGFSTAAPASAAQGKGWVDVTIDLTENAGWRSTSFYASPSTVWSGCPDSNLSFFFRFDYMVYNNQLTIANMRLTNGASRTDTIKANNFRSPYYYGDNLQTTSRWVRPSSRSYIYYSSNIYSSRTVLTGYHRNGISGRYINFDITSRAGGSLCGASVVVRLK